MQSLVDTFQAVGGIAGILALVGVGISYGALRQRVRQTERDLEKALELVEKVTRIDERTLSANRRLRHIEAQVDRIVGRLMPHEPRTFADDEGEDEG